MKTVEELEQEYNIKLIENHMIYFCDKDDYCVGVLAEDTNFMIRNQIDNKGDIYEKIDENIKLLKSWI